MHGGSGSPVVFCVFYLQHMLDALRPRNILLWHEMVAMSRDTTNDQDREQLWRRWYYLQTYLYVNNIMVDSGKSCLFIISLSVEVFDAEL